MGRSKPT